MGIEKHCSYCDFTPCRCNDQAVERLKEKIEKKGDTYFIPLTEYGITGSKEGLESFLNSFKDGDDN